VSFHPLAYSHLSPRQRTKPSVDSRSSPEALLVIRNVAQDSTNPNRSFAPPRIAAHAASTGLFSIRRLQPTSSAAVMAAKSSWANLRLTIRTWRSSWCAPRVHGSWLVFGHRRSGLCFGRAWIGRYAAKQIRLWFVEQKMTPSTVRLASILRTVRSRGPATASNGSFLESSFGSSKDVLTGLCL